MDVLLWVISGHHGCVDLCPLYAGKRTLRCIALSDALSQ
jgi:hypothetical protein